LGGLATISIYNPHTQKNRISKMRYDPEMDNVIPERELMRRRLIRKIDYYIHCSIAAGLITIDEVPDLKEKVRANNRWERRKQPR
jgi:hypothetical protein